MRKINSLAFFLSILCFHISAQSNQPIVIGNMDSIESRILNEKRVVWVYSPHEAEGSVFTKKKYPVVYLLDGDAHFYSVVGMIHQLSSINGNTICPEMIVVGIPNTNRTRDLTPTKGKFNGPFIDNTMIANSGGGANFVSFIKEELIPYIDSHYPTDSYRMFIGHSFGGLLVMNTLVHNPELFNAYVAIDPSMWWDDQYLLQEIKNWNFGKKYTNKSLFLGIANTMQTGMDTASVKQDTSFSTNHIRSILELHAVLNKNKQINLKYKGKYYHDDDHGSVPLITEYDAIRFIFDFYRLKIEMQDFMDPASDFLGKVINHYENLSKVFEREVKPDESFVNQLGYQFIRMQQFDKSEKFFKLNISNYPESFNVYDSLGDLYVEMGKNKLAIENYQKSISLNKDSYSKDKLEALKRE